MVDARDLKSLGSDTVWVQLPSLAPTCSASSTGQSARLIIARFPVQFQGGVPTTYKSKEGRPS